MKDIWIIVGIVFVVIPLICFAGLCLQELGDKRR